MTTYFVSRHSGAIAWAAQQGFRIDLQCEHLDADSIQAGDIVIGSLPVNLAAAVCARGGRYLHLTLELPREWRGRELTAAEMTECDARIEEFFVTRIDKDDI